MIVLHGAILLSSGYQGFASGVMQLESEVDHWPCSRGETKNACSYTSAFLSPWRAVQLSYRDSFLLIAFYDTTRRVTVHSPFLFDSGLLRCHTMQFRRCILSPLSVFASTLTVEVVYSFETFEYTHKTTMSKYPQGHSVNSHYNRTLKSHISL